MIESPDRRFAVRFGADFGEIRMGSPEFGKIAIDGCGVNFGERLFSGAVVFCADSKFVALEQLIEGPGRLKTQILVVDLEERTVTFAVTPAVGGVTPLRWEAGRLIYLIREGHGGAREESWAQS